MILGDRRAAIEVDSWRRGKESERRCGRDGWCVRYVVDN